MMVVLCIADRIISSLDSIRKQPFCAVALAEMMRDEWCSSHKSAKVSLQVLLKKIHLPGPMTKHLQGCFAIGRTSMQVIVTSPSLRLLA